MKPLRIVAIDCPYDTWNDERTRELFVKTVSLKLTGYRYEYPYGVLPVDTTDFIGTHYLVCEVAAAGSLIPLMGYKSTSLRRCRTFNVAFPGLALLQASGAFPQAEAVKRIIQACDVRGVDLTYDGSWTISPEARKDRELVSHLRGVMTAIVYYSHSEPVFSEALCVGMPRFKTDRYFEGYGFTVVKDEGKPLPPIRMCSLRQEPAILLHLREFTEGMRERVLRLRFLWGNRLILADPAAARARRAA